MSAPRPVALALGAAVLAAVPAPAVAAGPQLGSPPLAGEPPMVAQVVQVPEPRLHAQAPDPEMDAPGLSERPPVEPGGGENPGGGEDPGGGDEGGSSGEEDGGSARATPEALPDTGADPRALVLAGAALLLAGAGLRLRTADADLF